MTGAPHEPMPKAATSPDLLAPGMMPEPEFEKPQAVRQLPALRSVGAAQTRGMKGTTKKLAAMLAAQGSVAPPTTAADEGLAEVLQDQLKMAEARLMRTASQLASAITELPATVSPELDDVVIRDWDDGEQLGGDAQLEEGLSPLRSATKQPYTRVLPQPPMGSRMLALQGSPPDSPPSELQPVNIHQIAEDRTIMDSRDRFAKYDMDGDAELQPNEVQRMFRDMELQVDEDIMFRLIDRFDRDRSGTIDYDEWSKLCLFLNVGTQETNMEKQALCSETSRVEHAIPNYLDYIGDNHPQVASMSEYCARLMKCQGRITEAAAMAKQAYEIRARPYRTTSHGHGQGRGGADGHGHVGEVLQRKFVDDE